MAWINNVEAIMSNYGIPRYVWYPIMMLESGGNPSAYNPQETATGLFQIRRNIHPQYAGVNLMDPLINANIAARDFLAPAWRKARNFQDPGMQAAITWKEGLKPAWNSQKQTKIESMARNLAKSDSLIPGGIISQDNRSWFERWKDRFFTKITGQQLPSGLGTIDPKTGKVEFYRIGGVDSKTGKLEVVVTDEKGQTGKSGVADQVLTSLKMGVIYVILILTAILAFYLSTKEGKS